MTDKIVIDRDVVEQALEALESGIQYDYHGNPYSDNDAARCVASDALRAALEQPQVTSCVACEDHPAPGNSPCAVCGKTLEQPSAVKESLTTQPQVEQEPVAWMYDSTFMDGTPLTDWLTSKDPREVCLHEEDVRNIRPLYLHPQPPLQPLTDQQIHDCFQHRHRDKATERRMITRSIEFAHGITGEQA